MPLLNIVRKLAIQYMGNVIRAGQLARKDIIAQTITRLGLSAADRPDLLRDYRIAREMESAAIELRRVHNRTPLSSDFPRAPGDSANRGRYRYEVLITTSDGTPHGTRTTRGSYYSDSPESLQTVRRNINSSDALDSDWRTSPSPGRDDPPRGTQTISVLSISRVS